MKKLVKGMKMLNVKELAVYLRTSKGNIYNLINKNKIPYLKVSGLGIRFCLQDIENWLYEKNQSTTL